MDDLPETLSRRAVSDPSKPAPHGRIVVLSPPKVAGRTTVEQRALVFGRQGGAGHHALDDATVSRQHARMTWDGSQHLIEDCGSRNGTAVNGHRIGSGERTPIADGDVLSFGDVIAVYERGLAPAPAPAVSVEAIPGESLAARTLRARIQHCSADPAPVLLLGETGVGKEWCAREVHRLSGRRGGFIAANVAELTHELAESQLFGHEKGAFTGADRAQPGLFRAADGGTLFLDEVGELPLELQPKLLRALQEGEVRPVGATRPIAVNVRIVAATNRPLAADVEADRFRRDLYARLAFWEIDIAPLRRRRADLLAWVARLHRVFLQKRGLQAAPLTFEAPALERFLTHAWPENLRGLDRIVHRLATEHGSDEPITLAELEACLPRIETIGAAPTPEPTAAKVAPPRSAEELAELLAQVGSVRALAKHFGRDRRQIYRWLEQFGLKEPAGD